MITDTQLESLTKKEAIHLLDSIIGSKLVEMSMREAIAYQQELGRLKCWSCRGIASKLGLWKED